MKRIRIANPYKQEDGHRLRCPVWQFGLYFAASQAEGVSSATLVIGQSPSLGNTSVRYCLRLLSRRQQVWVIDAMAAIFGPACGATPKFSLRSNYENLDRLCTAGDNLLGNPNTTTYIYRPVGNLEKIFGTSATTATRVSRLTRETLYNASDAVAGTITHACDHVGNRRSRTVTASGAQGALAAAGLITYNDTIGGAHQFDARDQLAIPSLAGPNPRYDLNGNTVNYGPPDGGVARTYYYDAENQLVKQSSRGADVTISYDANGNRVSKTVAGVKTTYLVDESNPTGYAQVVEERQGGSPTVVYVYGLSLINQTRGTTTSYYGTDGQGSVRYLTSGTAIGGTPAGFVTDTYTYDAFGIQITSSGTTPNNFRYTGQQWDADLGMYYLRARYYQPGMGRFWTMDTKEGEGEAPLSLQKYLYCHADPVNLIDPSGHETQKTIMGKQVHKKLGEIFTGNGTIQFRFSGPSIAKIGGRLNLPIPADIEVLFPDLVDASRKEVYEIKPLTPYGLATGLFQSWSYVKLLNKIDPLGGWHLGSTWSPPSFLILPPTSGSAGGVAFIAPPVGGLIFYEAVTIQEIAKRGNRTVRSSQQSQLQQQMGIATILSTMGGF